MVIKTIYEEVIHGRGEGHKHGMPTANQVLKKDDIKHGVYASKTTVDNKEYISITNVGLRPSVDENKTLNVETWILDFSGDLYGKKIKVDLYYFIRETRKFNGLEEVKNQLDIDAKKARELFE
ncbi:MAG: riboflavin kinase [Solobacterium sp.]|nr:riboflavin kinase [Solobacterium sp.]